MKSTELNGTVVYKDELLDILHNKYNGIIDIVEDRYSYFLSHSYVFKRKIKRGNKIYWHQFSARLWEIIYTNILLKNSGYRNATVLDLYIQESGYYTRNLDTKNNDMIIKLNLSDGRYFSFKPDYYNEHTKTFIHYFDQSYYDSDKENIIISAIKKLFENENSPYNFIIYKDTCKCRCDFY